MCLAYFQSRRIRMYSIRSISSTCDSESAYFITALATMSLLISSASSDKLCTSVDNWLMSMVGAVGTLLSFCSQIKFTQDIRIQWNLFIGGSGGGGSLVPPPPTLAQNFFIFMQFGQIIGWCPSLWKSWIRHCSVL